MGKIFETFTLEVVRKKKVRALIDSGADYCLIRPDIAEYIGAELTGEHIDGEVIGDKKLRLPIVGLRIIRRDKYITTKAAVAKIHEPFIIGNTFLQDNAYRLDFSRDKIEFTKNAPQIKRIYRI